MKSQFPCGVLAITAILEGLKASFKVGGALQVSSFQGPLPSHPFGCFHEFTGGSGIMVKLFQFCVLPLNIVSFF